MKLHRLPWLFLTLLFVLNVQGQYTQIGEGGFASSSFGPFKTDLSSAFYSRYAYIYPSGALFNLKHGDSITAFEFKHRINDTLAGNCNLKIYVKNSSQADYGTGTINWLAQSRLGTTLVYEGNPKSAMGNIPGDALFRFNQVDAFVFDTTNGNNLEVLVEYTQNTNQSEVVQFYCESSFYVPAYISNDETKFISGSSTSGMDSITNSSSSIKPTIRIYHADNDTELETYRIYALGTVPVLMNRSDSIKTIIQNVGKKTVYNHKVYLDVTGSSTFSDSTVIDSIHPYEKKFVYFDSHKADTIGAENLKVTIGADGDLTNNSIAMDRLVSYNNYSQADPFSGSSGGIGFNGSTGDFVSRFYVGGTSYINQIKVDFNLAGRAFQLVVWDDNGTGGLPGTELFVSDSLTSTAGTFILPVLPRIQVSGGFYVGIRQTSNTNVSFSFQYERPVRPHTFYFAAPAQDTNWVSFSPGFDFNFNIQPRLQVANDLAILEMVTPQENDTFRYHRTDSLDIKASVINYGYQNQGFFNVSMDILNKYGQTIYTSVKTISLDAEDTVEVSFDKFSLYNVGEFTARAKVHLNTDSVQDNNTGEVTFHLVKDHDVAVDIIYSPTHNDSFEISREGFWPTVRLINYGIQDESNFPVRVDLVNQFGAVVDSQVVNKSIAAGLNEILTFDSMFLFEEGSFIFRAYTQMAWDSFPSNDTTKVTLHAKKTDDVQILGIIKPQHNKRYVKGTKFEPYTVYRNDGLEDQDSVYFYARIENSKKQIVYTDTTLRNTPFFSNSQIIHEEFLADTLGEYTFYLSCDNKDDQIPANDTASAKFSVVTGDDLMLVELLNPAGVVKINSSSERPEIIITNNGLNNANNVPISIEIENNFGQVTYEDTIYISISSFSSDTFKFNDEVSYADLGDFFVTVINHWADEDEPSTNDTIITSFGTRYAKDIFMVANINPLHGDTLEIGELVTPIVQLANYGIDTAKDVQVRLAFTRNGQAIFEDTVSLAILSPYTGYNYVSDTSWTAIEGLYQFTSTFIGQDDNEVNNEVVSEFEVVERFDMAIDSVWFPKDSSRLRVNSKYAPQMHILNEGIEDADQFTVHCEVKVDGLRIYNKSQIIGLAGGRDTLIQFDSMLFYDAVDIAEAIFTVKLLNDQDVSNDTVITYFNFVDGAGLNTLNDLNVLVYPNPTQGAIEVRSKEPIEEVRVYDIHGAEIMSQKPGISEFKMSINSASGLYIVEVKVGNSIERHQIIKL